MPKRKLLFIAIACLACTVAILFTFRRHNSLGPRITIWVMNSRPVPIGEWSKSAEDRRHHGRTAFAGRRWRPRSPLSSGTSAELDCVCSGLRSRPASLLMHQSRWTRQSCLENLRRTLPPDEPKWVPFLVIEDDSVFTPTRPRTVARLVLVCGSITTRSNRTTTLAFPWPSRTRSG